MAALATPSPAVAHHDYGSSSVAWSRYYARPHDVSTWQRFCAAGGGTVEARGDGFPACGRTGVTAIEVPGGLTTPGFQCVELSERALYVEHGWPGLSADGAQVAERYAQVHDVPLIHNGTVGYPPQVGDVMSFSHSAAFTGTGHTALVTASSVNRKGNGRIAVLSENWSDGGSLNSFPVRHWKVAEVSGYRYSEWVQSGPA